MKKTWSIVIIAILTIASVVGVTASVSRGVILRNSNIECESSELYEVVDFTPPDKTVYMKSEVETIELEKTVNGNRRFIQQIDFDGTGMSMTVRNRETQETKTYEYTCEYYDGVKCEYTISFRFTPEVNVELSEGVYTTEVFLLTDDSEYVSHEMEFTIIDDTKKESATQPQTEEKAKADNKPATQPKTESATQAVTNDKQEESNEVVVPQLKSIWNNSNNPTGCTIEVTYQDGNYMEMTITSMRGDGAQIATADVFVTLENVFLDGTVVRGEGSFEYTDSFGNSGTGSVSVSENVIILVIEEGVNAGRGWGVDNATGKYI